MKSLLHSAEILAILLFVSCSLCVASTEQTVTGNINSMKTQNTLGVSVGTSQRSPSPSLSSQPIQPSTTSTTTTTSSSSSSPSLIKQFLSIGKPLLAIVCSVFLACAFFLTTTLILTCKVCQLSRRVKTLRRNSDLISTSGYWAEADKKNSGQQDTEAKETSLLMTDVSQTNQEMGNGAAKEDGGQVDDGGQKTEEKEVGDAPESKEPSPPAADADSSSFPAPPLEVEGSEATPEPAASS